MHLRDFTEWNPLTAFLTSMLILIITAIVANYRDEKRHKKIIKDSDESARKSIERLRR